MDIRRLGFELDFALEREVGVVREQLADGWKTFTTRDDDGYLMGWFLVDAAGETLAHVPPWAVHAVDVDRLAHYLARHADELGDDHPDHARYWVAGEMCKAWHHDDNDDRFGAPPRQDYVGVRVDDGPPVYVHRSECVLGWPDQDGRTERWVLTGVQ
ncbi:MAG: hypothetical protein AAF081_08575 [Actinomycetota bacterium]